MPSLQSLFASARGKPAKKAAAADQLWIIGSKVKAATAEGLVATAPLQSLIEKLRPPRYSTGGLLPRGVRAVVSSHPEQPAAVVWVSEFEPQMLSCDWIANDSPDPFGPDCQYRRVRIALPYCLVLTVFTMEKPKPWLPYGLFLHKKKCELFFRNSPLRSLQDEAFYPALLNVSKFLPTHMAIKPLAWICCTSLEESPDMFHPDQPVRMRAGYRQLLDTLFAGKFNHSSEHHQAQGESQSWYMASRHLDPRIASVEAWEAASCRNPLFCLDIPWLPTGLSVEKICARIFEHTLQLGQPAPLTASGLCQLVVQAD